MTTPEAPTDTEGAPQSIPPVVAVVVTHEAGEWLSTTLEALAEQDYPELSVLVIDAGSSEDPTPRVAERLPGAYVRRLDENVGFAAAANEVLDVVEGASHYLFLHDDAAPDPDAVRLLVEEAYRSNAGIVAPKLVAWDDPRLLLAVGGTADKSATPVDFGRGELDQEQHDGVRPVFVAPGGCTLVRADLFAALGGFDPAMTIFGEDVDLCWRAQIAGARVVVAPQARVRHLEATASGARPLAFGSVAPSLTDRARPLQVRHRNRTVLKCYGRFHLLRVVPQLLVLALGELFYGLVTSRRHLAGAAVGAWGATLRDLSAIRRARRSVQRTRHVSDSGLRRLQARGSARVSAFVRVQLAAEERNFGVAAAGRELATTLRSAGLVLSLGVWTALALVFLIGSRDVLGGIPVIGQFVPFPESPGRFFEHFLSGWRVTGVGSSAPTPPAFPVLGIGGLVLLGSAGLLRTVVILGAIPVGIIGAYRLTRPLESYRPRLVATVLYAALPLPYDSVAAGRWTTLVGYAAAPWLISRLARATGLPPFGAAAPYEPSRREGRPAPHLHRVAAVDDVAAVLGAEAGAMDPIAAEEYLVEHGALEGVPVYALDEGDAPGPPARYRPPVDIRAQLLPAALVVALAGALAPATVIVLVVGGFGILLGSLLLGEVRPAFRSLAVGAVAVAGAGVLLFPWTLELVMSGWDGLWRRGSVEGFTLTELLRFDTGPTPTGPLGYGFVGVAALPLLIGRKWRFTWAARMWTVALVAFGLAWCAGRGWLGPVDVPPDLLLLPAGVALVLSAALGLAAFETDLPAYRFGWRQVASVVAAAAGVVAVLPALAAAVPGDWGAPRFDIATLFSWMPERRVEGDFRVLWVGDPRALPGHGWSLSDDLDYGMSRNGLPDALDLWPPDDDGATGLVADMLTVARQEETTRLGRLLAPFGVRYLVVMAESAPEREETLRYPVPDDFEAALRAQVDLRRIETDPAVVVYENAAWVPVRSVLPPAAAQAARSPSIVGAASADYSGAVAALPDREGTTTFRGDVPTGANVFVAQSASSRWQLRVDGRAAERERAFGWANIFAVERGGDAELSYRTSPVRYLAVALELILWLVSLRLAFVGLRRQRQATLGGVSP